MQSADIFESRDQNNIDLINGIETSTNEVFFKNFFKTLGGKAKPCISGSDAHKFEHYGNFPSNKTTWVKGDPTFEGLRQIIYEPIQGERVKIGSISPDQKDTYKVVSKIKFENSPDFPQEIVFNSNLCSIIGSRSSGKSALLAYLAHSIDENITESIVKGPGEGREFLWENIANTNLRYITKWANGKTSTEATGKVIYIPQNHLFKESKNPYEVEKKIAPVLYTKIPEFKIKYDQLINSSFSYNQAIKTQVDDWFKTSDLIESYNERIRELGDKNAIEVERKEIEMVINTIKKRTNLSEGELEKYKSISLEISLYDKEIEDLAVEFSILSSISDNNPFFRELKLKLFPTMDNLPDKLQDKIQQIIVDKENEIRDTLNMLVFNYKKDIEKNLTQLNQAAKQIREDNRELIEKHQNFNEIEMQIKKDNRLNEVLQNIEKLEKEKETALEKNDFCIEHIRSHLDNRKSDHSEIEHLLEHVDQGGLEGITFGVEVGLGQGLERISKGINVKENTHFVISHQIEIESIRMDPGRFLSDIYFERQKVITGTIKNVIASDVLTLTEETLFFAEMEGDRIGGFSDTTMTPGKRALFLLKLILAQSEDTWPLLIDQPEDDLDSRSVYDEIVPFLKEKKKERQIIMVSHNANLVIGADSEQIIVANRHGTDRKNTDGKQFNYLSGGLENSKLKDEEVEDTLKAQGIREHACEILDGGKVAFEQRKNKYNIV
jgi:hypothetical protein